MSRSRIIRLSKAPRKSTRETLIRELAYISQYKRVADPTNARSVHKQYVALRKFPLHLQRPADKQTREQLKKRGFFTTEKGVIIDGPRDSKRKPIKGAKLDIQSDGTISWTVTRRTKRRITTRKDYIVGFTAKEKKEFAANPNAFVKNKTDELKKNKKGLQGKGKIQVRLQWGAYQATKDFHQGYFMKQSSGWQDRQHKKLHDRLTGLHIVIHTNKHLSGLHLTKTTRKSHGKRNARKS